MAEAGKESPLLRQLVTTSEAGMPPPVPPSMTHSLTSWLSHMNTDDIDGGLAADFDGSLSGLGVELGSSTYNMSEALLALPVFKSESLDHGDSDSEKPSQKSSDDEGFQYVVGAATSPATKMNEETVTYLNQGQSYEIKLKKMGDTSQLRGRLLKSIIRVVFHERRLQYMEREQLCLWKQQRMGERILDIDIPLSYGILDMNVDANILNTLEIVWDPRQNTGIYIKVNCISTEFTAKKHGGEKGVPFRIQVETYLNDHSNAERSLLHGASCQIKVFKPKGADRKHKTDREKIEKRSDAEKEKYQPSYDCTVLTEIALDHVQMYLEQLEAQQIDEQEIALRLTDKPSPSLFTPGTPSASATSKTLSAHDATTPTETPISPGSLGALTSVKDLVTLLDNASCDSSFSAESPATAGTMTPTRPAASSHAWSPAPPSAMAEPLSPKATAQQVTQWLHSNRFSHFVKVFQNFTGADLLRLSREDLIQICGLADGIRLNNALQSRTVRPKLTIYVCQAIVSRGSSGSLNSIGYISGAAGTSPNTPTGCQHSPPIVPSTTPQGQTAGGQQSHDHSLYRRRSISSIRDQSPPAIVRPSGNVATPTNTSGNAPTTPDAASGVGPVAAEAAQQKRSQPIPTPTHAPKRRQLEAEEEVDEALYVKKQRTRNLELSRKGVYHAIYLEVLTLSHMIHKLAALFSVSPTQFLEVHCQGPSGIHILVTDTVVQNFKDQARYSIEAVQDEIEPNCYRVLLRSLEDT